MIRRTRIAVLAVAATLAAAPVHPGLASAAPGFTKQTLNFAVFIGPDDNVACNIVGDLYLPDGASATSRVPAVLTTSGFAKSKNDLVDTAEPLVREGYAVLAYSPLGFGGSGCKVTMDDPDFDGKAASQLVSFLGGAPGIAFRDNAYREPFPALDVVARDSTAVDGTKHANDPRVGMIGSSYGGQVQFAAAALDPRIDAIVPMITWNDQSYSLAPNNAGPSTGVSTTIPGAMKLTWAAGLGVLGAINPGPAGYAEEPSRALGCPNLPTELCAMISAGIAGYPSATDIGYLRNNSVTTYIDKIRAPVLLVQGQKDSLFDLNEARATYDALKRQGTEVKMIWQSWGHSDTVPAPGEYSAVDPRNNYENSRILDWFDHHLKDSAVSTGPEFAYFRDWVNYAGNAYPAYASASDPDVGTPQSFHLSGAGLATQADAAAPGLQTFATGPAGLPTSSRPPDPLSRIALPDISIPGTFARWTGAPQTKPMDVVGAPKLDIVVSTDRPPNGSLDDSLVVFAKLYDIAPNGVADLIGDLVAPARIVDPSKPIAITMPAIVHRFDTGHRLALDIAGGDLNYRGGLVSYRVSIASGPDQVLTLPVVAAS